MGRYRLRPLWRMVARGGKRSDIWDGVPGTWGRWRAKGAASLAASYVDLSGNGHTLAPIVAPSLVAAGWVFAGIAGLDTGFVAQTDQTQSMLVQFSGLAPEAGDWHYVLAGAESADGEQRSFIVGNWWNVMQDYSKTYMANGAHAYGVDGSWSASGNMGIAGNKQYINGIYNSITMAAWSGTSVVSVYIGSKHIIGGYDNPSWATIQEVVICDGILTAAQMLLAATVMAA